MSVRLANFEISQTGPFVLIAGPCQIESRDHTLMMAKRLKALAEANGVHLIYKSSFDKANRTSHDAPRGVGMDEGLKILNEVKTEFGLPIITDIHEREQCAIVAEVADILQIPAFLSRQTDLLQAAGRTGRVVMVKKGQFLAPDDMAYVAAKIAATGNDRILLCDRGTSFGYHTLVNDFRGIKIMADTGYPVIFDATHSTQSPGGQAGASGGAREMAPLLARAALAVGVAGLFIETHENPDKALSDGPAMMRIEDLERALPQWVALDHLIKSGA